jgi:hypothetical protein
MDGEMQLSNDGIVDHALPAGYIVIAPTSPSPTIDGPSWKPLYHRDQLIDILKKSAETDPKIDPNRIHVTGFSQGGFLTWDILCRASDTVCSVAPLAASGRDDEWGADVGFGDQCFIEGSPAVKRSVMFTIGSTDALSSPALSRDQIDSVTAAYFDTGVSPSETSIGQASLEAYGPTGSGINVNFYSHNSASTYGWGGHCFPTDPDGISSCQADFLGDNFGSGQEGALSDHRCCVEGFDYGAKVVDFFQKNPCSPSCSPSCDEEDEEDEEDEAPRSPLLDKLCAASVSPTPPEGTQPGFLCDLWKFDLGCDAVWSDVCDEDHPAGSESNDLRVRDGCPEICEGQDGSKSSLSICEASLLDGDEQPGGYGFICGMWVFQYGCDTDAADVCDLDLPPGEATTVHENCPYECLDRSPLLDKLCAATLSPTPPLFLCDLQKFDLGCDAVWSDFCDEDHPSGSNDIRVRDGCPEICEGQDGSKSSVSFCEASLLAAENPGSNVFICDVWVFQFGCDAVWGDVCNEDIPQGKFTTVRENCPDQCPTTDIDGAGVTYKANIFRSLTGAVAAVAIANAVA